MASLPLSLFLNYYFVLVGVLLAFIFTIKASLRTQIILLSTKNINIKTKFPLKSYLQIKQLLTLFSVLTLILYKMLPCADAKFIIIICICCFIALLFIYFQALQQYKTTTFGDILTPLSLPFYFFLLLKSTTYLHFLFYLEIIGYVFYFQFQNTSNRVKSQTYIKMLIYYYWANFFGTIFLFFTLYRFIYLTGTTNFYELILLKSLILNDTILYIILFLGLTIKLGAPGVHFLKIDLYKHLTITSLLHFSLLSLAIYICIYLFFIQKIPAFDKINLYITFLIAFTLPWVAVIIKQATNLTLIFGYSALLTIVTVLLIFI